MLSHKNSSLSEKLLHHKKKLTISSQVNKYELMNAEKDNFDVFSPELIKVNYYALDKKSCLIEMAEFLADNGIITSSDEFVKEILERERLMSTGIGKGIAIPHARCSTVNKLKIAVYILDNGLEFEAIDEQEVKIVLMIAVPLNMKEVYMKVLSAIANFFRRKENIGNLLECTSNIEIYKILKGIKL
jgi:fructose-specific phosphotransferase system IIA component